MWVFGTAGNGEEDQEYGEDNRGGEVLQHGKDDDEGEQHETDERSEGWGGGTKKRMARRIKKRKSSMSRRGKMRRNRDMETVVQS